jgi:hypothetical protein
MGIRRHASLQAISKILTDEEIRDIAYRRTVLAPNRYWYWRQFKGGVDFIEREWDTLILLDACRLDMFQDQFPWSAEPVVSTASESWSFMETQYEGRQLHDTVFVSANPYTPKLSDGTFHAVENLLLSDWDEDSQTVLPEDVTDAAIAAHERNPHKRIIVHYMQPHFPFLGSRASEIGDTALRGDHADDDELPPAHNPWREQMWGEGPGHDALLDAYRENYEIVRPSVERLVQSLEGRIAISADHANLVGERGVPIPLKMYGHPRNLYHRNLVTVPWVSLDGDERSTHSDPPQQRTIADGEIINDRLKTLGYKSE